MDLSKCCNCGSVDESSSTWVCIWKVKFPSEFCVMEKFAGAFPMHQLPTCRAHDNWTRLNRSLRSASLHLNSFLSLACDTVNRVLMEFWSAIYVYIYLSTPPNQFFLTTYARTHVSLVIYMHVSLSTHMHGARSLHMHTHIDVPVEFTLCTPLKIIKVKMKILFDFYRWKFEWWRARRKKNEINK